MWRPLDGFSLTALPPPLLLLLLLTCLGLLTPVAAFGTNNGKCERITSIEMCKKMRYNETKLPNIVGHTSQLEASQGIEQFRPLVSSGCSPLLQFFLCSVFAPMCTEQVNEVLVIPACRSMCEDVKQNCEPLLNNFGLVWPEILSCERLPVKSDMSGDLCMQAPESGQIDMTVSVGRAIGVTSPGRSTRR